MLDPLTNYSVNKFFLILIPKSLITSLPMVVTAILVSLVPYTPANAIIFALIFLVFYLADPFSMGSKTVHYCRFNKPNSRTEKDVWTTVKNTYFFYLMIAMLVNYHTISQYMMYNITVQ